MTEYAKHLFRAFDTDVDGYVSFEEVIVGFHHLSGSGDEKEKLKIVFRVSHAPTIREVSSSILFPFRYTTRRTTASSVQQTSRSKFTSRLVLQWAIIPCLRPHSIFSITKSQYLLQGKPLDDDEINSKVKSCFSQCDLNCDGKISEDEFFKAGRTVAEMFELEGDE